MIIRDLTLRSAASFGSFHLIRLLYDEYMFYLVEHKVAEHTGKSPMSVMAECIGMSSMGHSVYNGAGGEEEDEMDDSSNEGSSLPPSQPQTLSVENVVNNIVPQQLPQLPQQQPQQPQQQQQQQLPQQQPQQQQQQQQQQPRLPNAVDPLLNPNALTGYDPEPLMKRMKQEYS